MCLIKESKRLLEEQGRKRPLDTPKRKIEIREIEIERERERERGRER